MIQSTYEGHMAATVKKNLSVEELVNASLAAGEGELAANQALVVKTGSRTGRSPQDRFIVRDELTIDAVDWNTINQAIAPTIFTALWQKALTYLKNKPHYFVAELQVVAHPDYQVPLNVITELAWHNLFACNLFIRPERREETTKTPLWTLLCAPHCKLNGAADGVNSDAAIILNFTERKILICGTLYAGEMKKAMFSVLNFILPPLNILPMHCAANAGNEGDVALFFGLSGTGKTTLSADPYRFLIGDDEHGWGDEGVFNFEGGCYAKCIDLSKDREPLIWNAIRYGSVIENVVLDPVSKQPRYEDSSLTQNTRAAYPRLYIPKRVAENRGKPAQVALFLTCDLFGVLPPVARLTEEQAAYYFLSGYTALVGSTEVGQGSDIKPTFSTCFGAPFFPRPPQVYADLLLKRLEKDHTEVYLVNTGWSGGAFGKGGQRFSIPTTRAIVSAIVSGQLKNAKYELLPGFNLNIPLTVSHVETRLLNPINNYPNQEEYKKNASKLIELFTNNFKRFVVNAAIKNAGPQPIN